MLSAIMTVYKNNKLDSSLTNPITIHKLKQLFKNNKIIITDKNTYYALFKEFPRCKYIIYDKNMPYSKNEPKIINSIFELTDMFYDKNEYFVIGCKQLMEYCLPYIDKMYTTIININHKYSDIDMPKIHRENWRLINHEEFILTPLEILYIESEFIRINTNSRRISSNLFNAIVNCTHTNENIFGNGLERIKDTIDIIYEIDKDVYYGLLEEYEEYKKEYELKF